MSALYLSTSLAVRCYYTKGTSVKKREFNFFVFHKISGLLTVIKEGISIVLSENSGDVNKTQKHFLDIANRNVNRLTKLLNNDFKFQSLVSGEIERVAEKEDINEIIKKIQKEIAISVKRKGINFVFDPDETIPPETVFDGDLIKEALTNIIVNSINSTEKGSVTVTTSFKKTDIKVTVKDTGGGITKEELPYVFDPVKLMKLKNEVCLGLAISKEIIRKHNGKIWIESVFGKGTTVSFTIPCVIVDR